LILEPAAQQLADATAGPPFLSEMGYAVRYDGICHDFMMLDPLRQTSATRAAIAQATALFRNAFESE
jgi:hypothetical protein